MQGTVSSTDVRRLLNRQSFMVATVSSFRFPSPHGVVDSRRWSSPTSVVPKRLQAMRGAARQWWLKFSACVDADENRDPGQDCQALVLSQVRLDKSSSADCPSVRLDKSLNPTRVVKKITTRVYAGVAWMT